MYVGTALHHPSAKLERLASALSGGTPDLDLVG
jgi:hypothetical protein